MPNPISVTVLASPHGSKPFKTFERIQNTGDDSSDRLSEKARIESVVTIIDALAFLKGIKSAAAQSLAARVKAGQRIIVADLDQLTAENQQSLLETPKAMNPVAEVLSKGPHIEMSACDPHFSSCPRGNHRFTWVTTSAKDTL